MFPWGNPKQITTPHDVPNRVESMTIWKRAYSNEEPETERNTSGRCPDFVFIKTSNFKFISMQRGSLFFHLPNYIYDCVCSIHDTTYMNVYVVYLLSVLLFDRYSILINWYIFP